MILTHFKSVIKFDKQVMTDIGSPIGSLFFQLEQLNLLKQQIYRKSNKFRAKTRAERGVDVEQKQNKLWWIILFAAVVFLMAGIYLYEKRYY